MNERWIALTGGIGGAKLALGLAKILPPEALTVVVNTGDDFEHLGLHVSPDIDTTVYTLAGLANPELGWGRAGETWNFMAALEKLGGPAWFKLGDADLAMHVERTRRLGSGETLSGITADIARRLGVGPAVLPMSDDPVRTMVDTDEGVLPFQEYFVARQCRPRVRAIRFDGAANASISPALLAALRAPRLAGIVLCPSNPWLSVDPILAVPGMTEALREAGVPIIAVTPLIAGKAVKGPTAKIMTELGVEQSVLGIVDHYNGLIDGFILDEQDRSFQARTGLPTAVTNTLMRSLEDRLALARGALEFCCTLRPQKKKTA